MAALLVLVAIGYPVLIYFALIAMEPRQIALVLLGLLGLRLAVTARAKLASYTRTFWLPVVMVALVAVATATWNDSLSLLLAPTLINLVLLVVFGLSLLREESMVERFARLQVDHLSPEEIHYCRTVTVVWCGFFAANGALALALALMGDVETWTIYTGIIAYLLMGGLFALEFTYRHWRFRRYVGAFTDPLFRRVFPPRKPGEAPLAVLDSNERGDGGRHTIPEPSSEPEPGRKPSLRPELLAERHFDNRREQDLRVPEDLACWPGHFPELAIVPGVLQVDWAMGEIASWKGHPPELARIEALKFKRPLYPGQVFTLVLEADERRERFRFRLEAGSEPFSLGRIVLAGDEGAS
jgi:uncharacterized membrane protein/3-hydroxymyristoyl/3-hydroxydecanoyl-(acyl carrier protein) dehydratase